MNIKTAGLDDKIELFKASVKGMRVSFQSEAFEVQSLLWFSGCIGAQSRASPKAAFRLLTSSSQVLSILKTRGLPFHLKPALWPTQPAV